MSHYERLGIPSDASQADVKSAYRRLVLQHHPDRSKDPRSLEIFRQATEAYEVLSNPERRAVYDDTLQRIAKLKEEKERAARQQPKPQYAQYDRPRTSDEVQRLSRLYAQGRLSEAEAIAREVIKVDARQPIPYAVLGDIARSRGHLNEAAKMYAYAAQFDPLNPVYQRRYEQLLANTQVVTDHRSTRLKARDEIPAAPGVGLGLVVVAAAFVAFSGEAPVFKALSWISTWTAGLLFMLFFSGLAVGASLSVGNYLDRFNSVSTTAEGRIGPAVVLGAVALVSFWMAALLYLAIGAAQRGFNFSTTRLVLGVIGSLFLIAIGASISHVISPGQVLIWGGNVAYLGALVGWMVSDAFKQ